MVAKLGYSAAETRGRLDLLLRARFTLAGTRCVAWFAGRVTSCGRSGLGLERPRDHEHRHHQQGHFLSGRGAGRRGAGKGSRGCGRQATASTGAPALKMRGLPVA